MTRKAKKYTVVDRFLNGAERCGSEQLATWFSPSDLRGSSVQVQEFKLVAQAVKRGITLPSTIRHAIAD